MDESDCDFMTISDGFLCADDIPLNYDANIVLLLTKIDNLNPGYSKLKFAFPDKVRHLNVTDISVEEDDGVYLSSMLLKNLFTREFLSSGLFTRELSSGREIDISGPSNRITTPGRGDIDGVLAFPYRGSKISQEWLNRPRFHGWPSQKHLMDLKKLDWHLVPVGPQKDSELEWRICFTLGEQYLVKTFNITQIHLLILLKKIMNKSLKPLCSAFSSYTAKNLVFWMVEILAPENFELKKLSSLLMMSLQMLRVAVENEQLQNYMIPSRNLLKGKIFPDEKENIIRLLDSFIAYGPAFLTQEFSELQEAMQKVDTDTDLAQLVHKRYTDDISRMNEDGMYAMIKML